MTYNKEKNIAYIKAKIPKDRLEQFVAEIRAEERAKVFDEVIRTLAESEETILSDKQYYTLMELKEQK